MAQESYVISHEKIQESADFIKNRITSDNPKAKIPKIAIVCGSGLSKLGDEIKNAVIIPYSEIPHFPTTTVEGHKNQMIVGTLSKAPVIVLQGRFHFYEGFNLQQCTMYVRVLAAMDVEFLVVSNAAGGINKQFKAGDIMLIRDHIFISGLSGIPLLPHDDSKGFQFHNKKPVYDKKITSRCEGILESIGYEGGVHVGVYACLSGPNYQTIAETKFLETFGADAVGMSTVPEVLVANDCGIQVVAFSLITDECAHDYDVETEPNHAEIIEVCEHKSDSLKVFAEQLVDFLRCCCVCPGS